MLTYWRDTGTSEVFGKGLSHSADCLSDSRRIEDNIVITKTGSENLTTTIKDPDEMERIISAS